VIVDGSTSGSVEIAVTGPPEAELQVTAVALGPDRARLDLSVSKIHAAAGEFSLRATIAERHGIPVRLTTLSWEPLTPELDRDATASCRGRLAKREIADAFFTSELPAFGELRSQPIRLPGVTRHTGSMVVEVIGIDATGRPVAAWADLDPGPRAMARARGR
jgi:hypothetical protein